MVQKTEASAPRIASKPARPLCHSWVQCQPHLSALSLQLTRERLEDIQQRLRSGLRLSEAPPDQPSSTTSNASARSLKMESAGTVIPSLGAAKVAARASLALGTLQLPTLKMPEKTELQRKVRGRQKTVSYRSENNDDDDDEDGNDSSSPSFGKSNSEPCKPSRRSRANISSGKRMSMAASKSRTFASFLKQRAMTNKLGADGAEPGSPAWVSAGLDSDSAAALSAQFAARGAAAKDFEICLDLSRQYRLPLDQVKRMYQEFNELDLNKNGLLSCSEFEEAIRLHCRIPKDQDLPEHLVHNFWADADRNKNGELDFEEFLLFAISHEYSEEWMVRDSNERSLRQVARDHGFNLVDVEKVKKVFDGFDVDKSGEIDREEFKHVLCQLLGVKKASDIPDAVLKRYWLEVDLDGNGSVSLEEFVVWYLNQAGP